MAKTATFSKKYQILQNDIHTNKEETFMIVVMKPLASDASVKQVIQTIEGKGLYAHLSAGKEVTIIGVVGDKTK